MDPRRGRSLVLASILLIAGFAPRVARAASDVVTVGTVTANGSTIDVPVYILDVSGTPLGRDQPAGSRIQSFSIKVTYSPASAVQAVTFSRAGITANLTPTYEFSPTSAGSISLLESFLESTNPVPFTLNAAPRGDFVAHLLFTLSSSAAPASTIAITLDPSLTQLTDSGGTAATKETVANGALALVDGAINIPPLSLSLTPSSTSVQLGDSTSLRATLNMAAPSNTTINVSSSDTTVARVADSIVIPAGSTAGDVSVSSTGLGTATITASLVGGNSATASVIVTAPCTTPAAPQLNAPAAASAGTPYTVSWNAVNGATEYRLEESTDAGFGTATTTQTVASTSATFTHGTVNTRYYYRLRARNFGGGCDVFSVFSTAISVLINPVGAPTVEYLAVIGSLDGTLGSHFRTLVQLYNPKSVTISGKIIFHAEGKSGSAADPSLAYSIQAGRTVSYPDLLPAMGVTVGMGSADLVADLSSSLPVTSVRVYNDAGAAGTNGLAEDPLPSEAALQSGTTGALIAPLDMQKFRLNIGIRTLEAGATLTITVRDRDGLTLKTVTRQYGPTYFTQISSTGMLDYVLTGGETISFMLTSGSALIYGATTDNTTNDPSIEFVRRID